MEKKSSCAITWNFPEDTADQYQGFNDSGITTFEGNPIASLGREIIQNSLDAKDPRSERPVKVKFSLKHIPIKDFPDYEKYLEHLEMCIIKASDAGESQKAKAFFNHAKKAFQGKTIPVLVIDDFNTTGLKGPCEIGKPFYALLKASGQSVKQNRDAGGSFGIGKHAPYVNSFLRTIFVSTAYQDSSGRIAELAQGKSIFISHTSSDNINHQSKGYWGIAKNCMPVSLKDIRPWMRRDLDKSGQAKIGTSIFVVGFERHNWKPELLSAILQNFFAAIHDKKLHVEIDTKIKLTSKLLPSYFENGKFDLLLKQLSDNEESRENLLASKFYYKAYSATSDNKTVFKPETQDNLLGLCKLHLVVEQKMPKKVCFLRNGMVITDAQKGLKRFSNYKDFVGVFECLDVNGNELFRQMEPPAHDEFLPEFLEKSKVSTGKKALNKVNKWIKSRLAEHAKNPVNEKSDVSELAKYFGEDSDASGDLDGETNPLGKLRFSVQEIPRPGKGSTADLPGNDPEEPQTNSEKKKKTGSRNGDSHGPNSGTARKPISLQNVRSVRTELGLMNIYFTPEITAEIYVGLFVAGADTDIDKVNIESANIGVIENNLVKIKVTKGSRISLQIACSTEIKQALRVIAYEV